ncbi:MAG TPA: hypothetical protein VE242_03660 [Chthoniobacterales bacterium]|nr:hypothetical protein [Chthoniobacterales bacterium]
MTANIVLVDYGIQPYGAGDLEQVMTTGLQSLRQLSSWAVMRITCKGCRTIRSQRTRIVIRSNQWENVCDFQATLFGRIQEQIAKEIEKLGRRT